MPIQGVSASTFSSISTLSPSLLFAEKNKIEEIQAAIVCEAIESRAIYGKSVDELYLDDILYWQNSTEEVIGDCSFEVVSDSDIRIYLPSSNVVIRYYDPTKEKSATLVRGHNWKKTETTVINDRINRQVLYLTKALPAAKIKKERPQWSTEKRENPLGKPLARHLGEAEEIKPELVDDLPRGKLVDREEEFKVLFVWPMYKQRPARIASLHYLASALTDKDFILKFSAKYAAAHPESILFNKLAGISSDSLPNINIDILDLSMTEDDFSFEEFIKDKNYNVVGFSTLTDCFDVTKENVRTVQKVSPNTATVLGGWHSSALPEDSLEETEANLVVKGYGVETFTELILRLYYSSEEEPTSASIGSVSTLVDGIFFKSSEGTFVKTKERRFLLGYDEYPFPHHSFDRTVIDKNYREDVIADPKNPEVKIKTGFVFSSFGCPFKCKYCANPAVYKRYIARDLQRLSDEIEELYQGGARAISFRDETWSLHRERAVAIIALMQQFKDRANEEGSNFYWSCHTRADLLDRGMLEAMKASGLTTMYFGIESGDSALMKEVKSAPIDYDKVIENIAIANELRIVTFSYLQVGLPGQDFKSLLKTARYIVNSDTHSVSIFPTLPMPGSSYFHADNKGPVRIATSMTDIRNLTRTETDHLTSEEITMVVKCFDDLGKSKEVTRQIEALKSMGMNIMGGDNEVILGTLRTGAVIDLILNSHPDKANLTRRELLEEYFQSDSYLAKMYKVFTEHPKGPYHKEGPFCFLQQAMTDPEFTKKYDKFLTEINFNNGYEALKELDANHVYSLLYMLFSLYVTDNLPETEIEIQDITVEELKDSLECMADFILTQEKKIVKTKAEYDERNQLTFDARDGKLVLTSKRHSREQGEKRAGAFIGVLNENIPLSRTLLEESNEPILIRVPLEVFDSYGKSSQRALESFLQALQNTRKAEIELFYMTAVDGTVVPQSIYDKHGLRKPTESKIDPKNTVTLFSLLKGDMSEVLKDTVQSQKEINTLFRRRLGGVDPKDTQIMPVNLRGDQLGVIRGVLLGLRLIYIARQNENQDREDSKAFLKETLEQLRDISAQYGIEDFDLQEEELLLFAVGKINDRIRVFKKILELIPVIPLDVEEIRKIYEHAAKHYA